ncbi:MAG: metal-dependent transcriptional regulator [Clostridia bacterium]|nr:metal-dependent transcriptional regulator [Clostridia bacterium]
MRNNESAEMYLETIMMLTEKQPHVRSIDVVHETGYTKPSVSRAVGLLKKSGYISVDAGGYITLTEAGRALASKVLERHRLLTGFLIGIGVDPEIAADDACKMEHIISDETFEKMKQHAALAKQD